MASPRALSKLPLTAIIPLASLVESQRSRAVVPTLWALDSSGAGKLQHVDHGPFQT